jgi:hypothetical protein
MNDRRKIPEGQRLSEAEQAALVTRDAMIGVALVQAPPVVSKAAR